MTLRSCASDRMLRIDSRRGLVPLAAAAAPCPGNPDALGTERVLDGRRRQHAAGRPQEFPATLPLAAQGTGAHLRRRPLADHHAESSRRAQGTNACARPSSCSAAMSQRIPSSRGANWPRATASATTRFRIPCSPAWRRPRPRPRSTAASPRTNSRSTAGAAAIRPRRFSAFPVSPRTRALLDRLQARAHRGVRRRRLGQRLAADDARSRNCS